MFNFSAEDIRLFAKSKYGNLKGLSVAMGISQAHLAAYLNGNRNFGASFREKLAKAGFFDKNKQSLSDETEFAENGIKIDINSISKITKLSLEDIAGIIGVSENVINEWVNNLKPPSALQISQLLKLVIVIEKIKGNIAINEIKNSNNCNACA